MPTGKASGRAADILQMPGKGPAEVAAVILLERQNRNEKNALNIAQKRPRALRIVFVVGA
jgi:hypothetical protein